VEEVAERDLPRGRDGAIERPVGILEDAQVRELRGRDGDGIVEAEPALVGERQRGDARDRLGQRRDPEDRVAGHRQIALDVAASHHHRAGRLPRAPGQADEAGQLPAIDVFPKGGCERGRWQCSHGSCIIL
jgi:hypothetical protein